MNMQDARDLLPWYAAGTLDAKESAALAAVLAESAELRGELRELEALQKGVAAPRADEPAFRTSLIAGAWQRIEAYEAERRAARGSSLSEALEGVVAKIRRAWVALPGTAHWALATQAVVIVVLAGALVLSLDRDHAFSTLSGPTATTAGHGPRLTVAFAPTATEAEIRALLQDLDAQVISGPSNEQLYTLQLADSSDAAADAALRRLRARTSLVRFAARQSP
jgi:hypothetical protein